MALRSWAGFCLAESMTRERISAKSTSGQAKRSRVRASSLKIFAAIGEAILYLFEFGPILEGPSNQRPCGFISVIGRNRSGPKPVVDAHREHADPLFDVFDHCSRPYEW